MPENNEPQYELDENYEPLGIVDAADGSGTTWPEFIEQVNKMDNQVAALTEDKYSRYEEYQVHANNYSVASKVGAQVIIANSGGTPEIPEDAEIVTSWVKMDSGSEPFFLVGQPTKSASGSWFVRAFNLASSSHDFNATINYVVRKHSV